MDFVLKIFMDELLRLVDDEDNVEYKGLVLEEVFWKRFCGMVLEIFLREVVISGG